MHAFSQAPQPKIGLWLTVWWTADDQFNHWSACNVMPKCGRYTSGDPAIMADHYAQFRDLGIDFLVMDDTNCVGNDGGRINDNIKAWLDFMDTNPVSGSIKFMRSNGFPR